MKKNKRPLYISILNAEATILQPEGKTTNLLKWMLSNSGAWFLIIAGIVGLLYSVLTGSYVIFFPSAYLLILGFRMRGLIRRGKFADRKVLQSLQLWVMPRVSSAVALFWLFLVLYNLQDLSRMR